MSLNQSRERERPVVCSANQSPERQRRVVFSIPPQRGFTLLEALVATAVLGAAVAALLGLLSGSLRNAARLEAPERALLLGQGKLNELIAAGVTEENPSTALGTGAQTSETHALPFDQTIAGRWDERFRWEVRATRFRSSPERTPGEILLARITLDVFWRTGAESAERKLSFETYQLRREPAEEREQGTGNR
jgi:prepilin-type N-terminal cleavage/methylation domain-containing protein